MRYESVGRGFESLPSHQEKPVHIVYWFFFFVCAMERARTGRRRIAPQAISPVQQRRPQPAAETGRSCWGRVLIFQSPCQGAAEKSANATRCCCLARGFQRVGMSTMEAVNRKISWLFCFSGRVCTLYKKAMNSLHRLHSVYFAAQKLSLSGHCPDKLGGICDKGYHGSRRASR